jgi:Zn finger protein HypA/HybF involved in hydrogenase expression
MFAYFYQVCLVIFLLQGFSIPILPIISGVLWLRRSRQLESLEKELNLTRQKNIKSDQTFELILNGLPKLRPLNCEHCGGSVLLQESTTLCPYCQTRGELPEDYAAAITLKSEVNPLAGWVFFLLIFIEPLVLFPAVIIGSNLFPDTRFDRAFAAFGETTSFLLMLSAFFGFIIWMIVFIFLAKLSKSLRVKLPVVPVFEGETGGRETASCQACGGGIEYDAGAFACLCGYCNVENFRARFVRRERARSEEQKTRTEPVLFGAMEILEDFVGTFFFVSVILVGASMLLTIFYAVKNLL